MLQARARRVMESSRITTSFLAAQPDVFFQSPFGNLNMPRRGFVKGTGPQPHPEPFAVSVTSSGRSSISNTIR